MSLDEIILRSYDAVIEPILFLFFASAFVIFVFSVANYLKESDSDDARKKWHQGVGWGFFGMLLMVSAIGIINIILGTFGITPPPGWQQVKDKFQGTLDNIEVIDAS